ncbi:MAG: PSD1 and planctomycete cytochrome C domain-containing protein [Mariniblastus sp.]
MAPLCLLYLMAILIGSPCIAAQSITSSQTSTEKLPEQISFNFHVRSILSENCYYCHGPDPNQRKSDLRLDTAEGASFAITAGAPDDSELIARILSTDPDDQMPPPDSGRSISDREKQILSKWVQQGAKYETHWAFVPPKKSNLPKTQNTKWGRNSIDQFVLANLESKSIQPSPRAEPHVIVRRLHLDLIGLPPTGKQADDFVAAYKKAPETSIDNLIDRLMANPHYGERMALPWLDAARYSDSNGFQQDGDRNQWPWRDWVVKSLNENLPFDEFSIQQLAGDLLPNPTDDLLVATAFNRNHMLNGEGGAIAEEQRNNYVFDRVDTTATTWLGLTMACAQCHDHKYDPITQIDYYRFFAYFNSVDENGGVNRRAGRLHCANPLLEIPTKAQKEELARIEQQLNPVRKKLSSLDAEIIKSLRQWEEESRKLSPDMPRDFFRILQVPLGERSKGDDNRLKDFYLKKHAPDRFKSIRKQQESLDNQRTKIKSNVLSVMIMRDKPQPRTTHLFDRGNYESPREKVEPGVPSFLPELPSDAPKNRLTLARWLVDSKNPLTSRVAVNRYWQTFFGTGLVKTSEDFGVQGELPSHPELLDWLAVDFMENNWDVKRIHRMIVTSETYLQSSKFRKDLIDVDPANRLLARSPRFRLPSSLIRDSALRVSGLLNTEIGGKPVYPYQPDGLWKEFSLESFSYKPSTGSDLYRRSLYTFWRRTVAPPNMFDSANRQTCTVKLSRTNTPLHALVMLNDPTFVESFCHLAQEVIEKPDLDSKARLSLAFHRAISRQPNSKEISVLTKALKESQHYYSQHPDEAKELVSVSNSISVPDDESKLVQLAALSSVVQIIMNTDEFVTRE